MKNQLRIYKHYKQNTNTPITRPPSRRGGIGHMLIILPTKFTGSAFKFRHFNHSEKEFKPSAGSRSSYQVIAWYSDVELIATPVISGNLCAFVYTIYHKEIGPLCIPSLFPAADLLSTETCFKYRLRHILRRWSQQCKQVAISETPSEVNCSLKMVFPKNCDLRYPVDFISRLLIQAAKKEGFGALHATLTFVQTRNASPPTVRQSSRGYYETWDLDLDDGFIEGDEGTLEIDGGISRLDNTITAADQAFYKALGGCGWRSHIPTEVVGDILDMSLCPSREVSVDWDKVDFQTGKGQVLISRLCLSPDQFLFIVD